MQMYAKMQVWMQDDESKLVNEENLHKTMQDIIL